MPASARMVAIADKARKAALLYLEGDVEMHHCCERYGVSKGAAWRAVKRIQAERAAAQDPR